MAREALRVGLAGLGAVGLDVARRIEAGIPGLVLAAVSVRDRDKARRNLPQVGDRIPIVAAEALAETCDLVVECLPPAMFRAVALSVDRARQAVHAAVASASFWKTGIWWRGRKRPAPASWCRPAR